MTPRTISEENIPPPDYVVCPISLLIYLEPVTAVPSGHVYEKEMLMKLISDAEKAGKKAFCPITREPIKSFVPAYKVSSAVKHYLDLHSEHKTLQYKCQNLSANNQENIKQKFNSSSMVHIQEDEQLTEELMQERINNLFEVGSPIGFAIGISTFMSILREAEIQSESANSHQSRGFFYNETLPLEDRIYEIATQEERDRHSISELPRASSAYFNSPNRNREESPIRLTSNDEVNDQTHEDLQIQNTMRCILL